MKGCVYPVPPRAVRHIRRPLPDATESCGAPATHRTGYGLRVCAVHAMSSDRFFSEEDGRSQLLRI